MKKMGKKFQYLEWILVVLQAAVIMWICVDVALQRIYFSDFVPINGDFQNYNGYRRLLAGQIPFRDFCYYLGLGPLYLNTLPMLVVGKDFTASLFVTQWVTAVLFGLAIFAIGRCSGVDYRLNMIGTLGIVMWAAGLLGKYGEATLTIFQWLDYIHPGHSERPVRMFLPFLWVYGWLSFQGKLVQWSRWGQIMVYGVSLGAGVCWSYDFGIASYIAACYMLLLHIRNWDRSLLTDMSVWAVGSCAGLFLTVSVLTGGNFVNWYDYFGRGVRDYQFWYYSAFGTADKVMAVKDLPYDHYVGVGAILILYLSFQVIKRKALLGGKCLLFLLVTTLIAGYGYAWGSNKGGLLIPFYMVIFLSFFFWGMKGAEKLATGMPLSGNWRRKTVLAGQVVMFIFAAYVTGVSYQQTLDKLGQPRAGYVPELGGYLSQWSGGIQAAKEFVRGKTYFSTYASAVEAAGGTFQPSGYDYIIHVLGDRQRKEYMETFRRLQPEYVSTLRDDFSIWEMWVRRNNWFFYREMLPFYRPVHQGPYNVIWQRTEKRGLSSEVLQQAVVKVNQVNLAQVVIRIEMGEKDESCIGDLEVSYKTKWRDYFWVRGNLRKNVSVKDGWTEIFAEQLYRDPAFYQSVERGDIDREKVGQYLLPEEGAVYLPIKMDKGQGQVELTACPENNTCIEIERVVLHQILPVSESK